MSSKNTNVTVKGDETNKDNKDSSKDKKETVKDYGGTKAIEKEFAKGTWCLYIAAFFAAFVNGGLLPMFGVLFREILDVLMNSVARGESLADNALKVMFYFMAVGFGMGLFTFLQYELWSRYASVASLKVRKEYFQLLLRQEVAYYDENMSGDVNSKFNANCLAIEEGIGVKSGFTYQNLWAFFIGISLAFVFSWRMALILLACIPVIGFVGMIQGKAISGEAGQNADPFVPVGGFVTEVLVNIRTVVAFPTLVQSKITEINKTLDDLYPTAVKRSIIMGLGFGAMMFCMFGVMYTVGLTYGSYLVSEDLMGVDDLFGCFFSFMIAGMSLGQMGSVKDDMENAKVGANNFFALREREIQMRKPEDTPITKKDMTGEIEFRNVKFHYPSAPDVPVLPGLSFKVRAGEQFALVGPSGSGKSTVISLIERYYDPVEGEIYVDGEKIHNYDINYLRSKIGLVSQLPLLFNESISDNIKGGGNFSQEEIEAAAKKAFAHEFVMALPDGYDTKVGDLGGRLSGGQKQRIAIARALVGKPTILLLDEATSALDTQSEREVQQALDRIAADKSHTVIAIAHRLSTIKDSDSILVLVNGEQDDIGTHEELMQKDGMYAALVRSQELVQQHKK